MLHIEIFYDIFKYVNNDKSVFSLRLTCREFSKFRFRLNKFYVMKKEYGKISRVFYFDKVIIDKYLFEHNDVTHVKVLCDFDENILKFLNRNITYLYIQNLIRDRLSFQDFEKLIYLKVKAKKFYILPHQINYKVIIQGVFLHIIQF